jgi:hypothetical protein
VVAVVVALAFLIVIPQESAPASVSALAFVVASEIGPGFSPDKLPGQRTPTHITSTVHALQTRNLLDALLRHQIQTPAQLDTWAQQSR